MNIEILLKHSKIQARVADLPLPKYPECRWKIWLQNLAKSEFAIKMYCHLFPGAVICLSQGKRNEKTA